MARDISELGADVFDDTPKKEHKFSPKKRNYIIGLSITGAFLIAAGVTVGVLCNTVLTDYANVTGVMYYFTPETLLKEGEEVCAVLYKLPSDKKFPSTYRIPSQVKGYKVVGVAEQAFASHSEIKHVIMPDTLTFIGDEAFANCTNLSKFTWSKNLTDIGVDAFKGTAFYSKITKDSTSLYDIPSGVLIYAGKDYFPANTALVSDSISEAEINAIKANYSVSNVSKFSDLNVKSICSGAFKGNDKITYVDLPEALDEISASTFEGCDNLEGIDGTHSHLKEIGKRAFASCENLKDILLPTALESLGDEAFAGIGVETSIPDISHVKTLGESIFKDCKNLTSLTYTANTVTKYMFSGCSSLSTILWGDATNSNMNNVTEIGMGAFQGTGFTNFVIPKNVSEISDFLFQNCEHLETVSLFENANDESYVIPSAETVAEEKRPFVINHAGEKLIDTYFLGVQTVKESAFQGCSALSTINLYDYDADNHMVFSGNNNEFTFPYSMLRCDGSSGNNATHYTFAGTCPTKVTFSPNMKHIGAYAFYNVTTLEEVEIQQFDKAQLATIKSSAFEGCSALTTMPLPSTVIEIKSAAFAGCVNLSNISIANLEGVTAINARTFYDCQAITELKLPSTISSIKSNAFYRTYNLNYVVIPEAIREVLDNAFTQCRENEGDTMDVFIERTYASATSGSKKVNFGKKWKDATVKEYYLLGDGEERVPGRLYWQYNGSGEPEII